MSINFDQVSVYTRQLVKSKLHSGFVQNKPLLAVLAGSKANLDRLGDPKMGAVWGGNAISKAQLISQSGSYQHEFRFQAEETDAASFLALDDLTPSASKYADDLVKKGATRWTDSWAPIRVRKDRADAAKDKFQIASVFGEAVDMALNKFLQKHQTALWTGTLTEAQQSLELWPTYLGLQHTVDSNTALFYGGQSRNTYATLQGKEVAAATLTTATILTTDIPNLKMIRALKMNNTYGGITNRYAKAGMLGITTPGAWLILANDAETKHTIFDKPEQMPPQLRGVSMGSPVIQKDNTYIIADPDCPDGEFYLLTPEFFVFEVEAGNNFVTEPWQKSWVNDEGGGKHYYTTIHAKTRLTCYRPDLQVKVTGLAD